MGTTYRLAPPRALADDALDHLLRMQDRQQTRGAKTATCLGVRGRLRTHRRALRQDGALQFSLPVDSHKNRFLQ